MNTIGMVAVAFVAARDQGRSAANQSGRQLRQPSLLTFRPAVIDFDVAALYIFQPYSGKTRRTEWKTTVC
jgi:hypothetical protein